MEQAGVFVPSAEVGQGQGLCDVSGNLPLIVDRTLPQAGSFSQEGRGVHQFGGTEGPNEVAGCK